MNEPFQYLPVAGYAMDLWSYDANMVLSLTYFLGWCGRRER